MIVVILPLLLLAIGAIILILSARRGRVRLTAPICGACGYNVSGLANMTCPECGNDLRRVGILTPSTPGRPRGPLGGIIFFTAIVIFVAFVSSSAILSAVPQWHSDTEQMRLASPRSGAYRDVVVHAEGASYLPKRSGLPVEIDLTPNPASSKVAAPSWMLARPDGSYEFVASGSPHVARSGGFGAAAVLEWMKAAGIDVTVRPVSEEAARIAGEVRLIRQITRRTFASEMGSGGNSMRSGGDRGPFTTYTYSQRANTEPPIWPPFIFLLMWLAIWASGIRYLWRRWRQAK